MRARYRMIYVGPNSGLFMVFEKLCFKKYHTLIHHVVIELHSLCWLWVLEVLNIIICHCLSRKVIHSHESISLCVKMAILLWHLWHGLQQQWCWGACKTAKWILNSKHWTCTFKTLLYRMINYLMGCWIRPQCVYIDGLVQERRNSSVLAVDLHLSFTNHLYICSLLCLQAVLCM